MEVVVSKFGEVLTSFLNGISGLWAWLVTPIDIFGLSINPLAVLGASFVTVLGFVFVKSIIF